MQNLISEKVIIEEGYTYLQTNPIGKIFSEANYFINLAVCEDPLCNCGVANIQLVREEYIKWASFEYLVQIDVHKEEVKFSGKKFNPNAKDVIKDWFSNNLTSKDWQVLRHTYFSSKFILGEEINPKEISFEFEDEDYLEETAMFPYYEFLPCSVFYQEFLEKQYIILDLYCKNPSCQCCDMVLEVLEVKGEKRDGKSSDSIGTFHFNYETGEEKIEGESPEIVKSIIEQLFAEHDNIDKLFRRRNQVIRLVYGKAKLKFHKKRKTQLVARTTKIGRNKPCPCGSGKKYKRCCL